MNNADRRISYGKGFKFAFSLLKVIFLPFFHPQLALTNTGNIIRLSNDMLHVAKISGYKVRFSVESLHKSMILENKYMYRNYLNFVRC